MDVSATYDSDADTYRASVDSETEPSLCWGIISLVSIATETDPIELDPIFDVIDPDALEKLFRSRDASNGRVGFEFAGCTVTVTSNGEISVSGTGRHT